MSKPIKTIRKCIYDAPVIPSELVPEFFSTHQRFVFDGTAFYNINGFIVSSLNSLVPFDPLYAYGDPIVSRRQTHVNHVNPQLQPMPQMKESKKSRQFINFISNPANLTPHTLLNEISNFFHYNEYHIKTHFFQGASPDIFMFINESFESLVRFRLLCTLGIIPYFINPSIFKIVIRGGMALRMQILHTQHMDHTRDSSELIEGAPLADIDCMVLIDRHALNHIPIAGTTHLSEKIEIFKTAFMKILLFSIRRTGSHIITCDAAKGDKSTTKIVLVDQRKMSHELADISFKFLDDDIIKLYQETHSPFIYDYSQQIYPNSLTCHWSFIHINALHGEYEMVSKRLSSKLKSISDWEAIPEHPEEKIFPIPSLDPRVPEDVTDKIKTVHDKIKFDKKNEIVRKNTGTAKGGKGKKRGFKNRTRKTKNMKHKHKK